MAFSTQNADANEEFVRCDGTNPMTGTLLIEGNDLDPGLKIRATPGAGDRDAVLYLQPSGTGEGGVYILNSDGNIVGTLAMNNLDGTMRLAAGPTSTTGLAIAVGGDITTSGLFNGVTTAELSYLGGVTGSLSGAVKRVLGDAIALSGVPQDTGVTIPVSSNKTFAIELQIQSLQMSTSDSFGFRLYDAQEQVSGYRAGHSRIQSGTTSVSTSLSWFALGGMAAVTEDYYGYARLQLVNTTLNRWTCESNLYDLSGANIQRMSSGTKALDSALSQIKFYGGGTGTFTGGSITPVYYVTV